jgi:protein-S-isoprenylcysteine O-methyltransferase Ste14
MMREIEPDDARRVSGSPRVARPNSWRWTNVPIPEAHLGIGAFGSVLSVVWPRRITWEPARWIGWFLLCGGVALAAWATRAADTTDLTRPDRLVTSGPYALSRHPMYVAWTAIFAGLALVARAVWPLLLMPFLVVVVHRETGQEEERLADAFGVEYQMYRARVRRYV